MGKSFLKNSFTKSKRRHRMDPQKFDGTYNVTIFIPQRGQYQTFHETMTIATARDGQDDVLKAQSRLTFLCYEFQLSGRINAQTGLASISGQAIGAGVALDTAPWSFISNEALRSVSAARVVFNGAAAIGFCFSLFGLKEGQEAFETQSIPDILLKDFQRASRPVAKI